MFSYNANFDDFDRWVIKGPVVIKISCRLFLYPQVAVYKCVPLGVGVYRCARPPPRVHTCTQPPGGGRAHPYTPPWGKGMGATPVHATLGYLGGVCTPTPLPQGGVYRCAHPSPSPGGVYRFSKLALYFLPTMLIFDDFDRWVIKGKGQ